MYTIDDIQVFVATHNRADLLQETLQSLLNQSARPKKITVLDNESTDNTAEVVRSLSAKGVEYVPTKGFFGNLKKANELANKTFMMIFHDDDLLHPAYLQTVVKLLNKYPNANLVTSSFKNFQNGKDIPFPQNMENSYYYFTTQQDWASFMFLMEGICYAPAVYRTESYLKLSFEYEKFGKFYDWPILCKMAAYPGGVVFLDEKDWVHLRQHAGQWTESNVTSPLTLEQIANWNLFFYQAMQAQSILSPHHYAYGMASLHFLEGKYKAFTNSEYKAKHPIKELEQIVKKQGGLYSLKKHPLKFLFHPIKKSVQKELLSQRKYFN